MLTQPPSDRTRAKGGPPSPEFWILPKYAKRTQSHPTDCLNYAKRTQFPNTRCPAHTKHAKRTQFPQVSDHPKPRLCETNPIRVSTASGHPIFLRNEPNFTPRRTCGGPKNAKRTQFTAIYTIHNIQYTILPPAAPAYIEVLTNCRNLCNYELQTKKSCVLTRGLKDG